MSTIVYLRSVKPRFDIAARFPGAALYEVAGYWVGAVGGQPTPVEVDAVVNPPQVSLPMPVPLAAALVNPARDRVRELAKLRRAVGELPADQQSVPSMITSLLEAAP